MRRERITQAEALSAVRGQGHPGMSGVLAVVLETPDLDLDDLSVGAHTISVDEPVRWETDFGAAELSQLNLYDRTVEGLVLRDVAGATVQYHPEAGPGPHDARHLFDRFLELAA